MVRLRNHYVFNSSLSELVRHDENGLVFENAEQLASQLKLWFRNYPQIDERHRRYRETKATEIAYSESQDLLLTLLGKQPSFRHYTGTIETTFKDNISPELHRTL